MENLAYAEDDLKYELINGVEIAMTPARLSHITVMGNLHRIIANFLRKKRCRVFLDPSVRFDEDNIFIPDAVVCDSSKLSNVYIESAPALRLKLKLSLYDDLEFDISDVFEGV